MKLVINTAHQRFGGAIQVALSFIEECKIFSQHEFHVWVGPGIRPSLKRETFPDNFTFYDFDFGVIGFKVIGKIQKKLTSFETQIRPDVIISTSGPTYFNSKAPQIIGFNLPLYIYPESPYVQSLSVKKKLKLAIKKKMHYYYFNRDASAYVVQTEDVNRRVTKALNTDEVYTVTNTYNGYYIDPKRFPDKLPVKQEGELRFLTISAYYPHKNLEIIPRVAEELQRRGRNNIRFILTLQDQDFKQHISPHPAVQNIGPVKPEECPSLYQECDMLFLPTLAECFSASYAEAMVMEKPIITTDLGFAKSICGDAAQYYEAANAKAAADVIEMLLADPDLSKEMIHRGLDQVKNFDNPKTRATKYIQLCDKMVL